MALVAALAHAGRVAEARIAGQELDRARIDVLLRLIRSASDRKRMRTGLVAAGVLDR
jgi:hypothetical protein